MELTLGAWFNEPDTSFEFSYRIEKFIRLAIKEHVMLPLGLIDQYPEKFLHLSVTTTSLQEKLEVKMGPFKEKSTSVNCGLWFPFNSIINSANPLEEYVENYIHSIPLIFKRWQVTEQQIKKVSEVIRNEIFNNPYYELTEEEKSEIERENISNKKIIKELGL